MRNVDFIAAAATTGVVAAGVVVLFEAALVPGLVIGGAAVLAPKLMSGWRRTAKAARSAPDPQPRAQAARASFRDFMPRSVSDLVHIRMSQAVVKTITFRVIVTSLDFTANYLILQEATTAAGLSAISLVGGPLFYFFHEGTWNYLEGSGKLDRAQQRGPLRLLANRPLAKTITFRTLASLIEFTTNYVVVRDLGTAALLTSFGFFLGPFVYYGHELAWERFGQKGGTPARRGAGRSPVIIDVEPVPASA
jgi:uncharacterized membrane protein